MRIKDRQHPDNPDLFWCPKCETYKERIKFGYYKKDKNGVYYCCKNCLSIQQTSEKLREYYRNYFKKNSASHLKRIKKYRTRNKEKYKKSVRIQNKKRAGHKKQWEKNNPEKRKISSLKYYKNNKKNILLKNKIYSQDSRQLLTDVYIKQVLNAQNIPITTETIELKRQQIKLFRAIREIKNDLRSGNQRVA